MFPLQQIPYRFLDEVAKGAGEAAREVLASFTDEIMLYIMGILICATLVIFIMLKEAEALECVPTVLEFEHPAGRSIFFSEELSPRDDVWDKVGKIDSGKVLKDFLRTYSFDMGTWNMDSIDDSCPVSTTVEKGNGVRLIHVK